MQGSLLKHHVSGGTEQNLRVATDPFPLILCRELNAGLYLIFCSFLVEQNRNEVGRLSLFTQYYFVKQFRRRLVNFRRTLADFSRTSVNFRRTLADFCWTVVDVLQLFSAQVNELNRLPMDRLPCLLNNRPSFNYSVNVNCIADSLLY